jgi:hypothetical protein
MCLVAERDAAGRRKVRLMTVWVGIGVAILVAGFFTSPWIALLGACIIGSTPVWFTLRMALTTEPVPKRPPEQPPEPLPGLLTRTSSRAPDARRARIPRRRGHD